MQRSSRKRKREVKKTPSGLQPYRRTSKRIGRNDPCPCGSELKAKVCCLRRIRVLESIPPGLREKLLAQAILQPQTVKKEEAQNEDT